MSSPLLETPAPVVVAALYRFARFDDCEGLRQPLDSLCRQRGVRGTLLLAPEGINGTIAGSEKRHLRRGGAHPGPARLLRPRREALDGSRHAVSPDESAREARNRDHGRGRDRSVGAGRYLCRAGRLERADLRPRHDRDRHAQRLRGVGRDLCRCDQSADRQLPRLSRLVSGRAREIARSGQAARRSPCSAPAASAARNRPPF